MENVLIYTQEHPTLGSLRAEVIVKGFSTTFSLFINDQFCSRGTYSDMRVVDKLLKGFTLTERAVR